MWGLKMRIVGGRGEGGGGGGGAGGTVGWMQPRKHGLRSFLWEGRDREECIYDNFSFLALGESAAWELTPFTPLALSFFDLLLEGTTFFFKV